MRRLFSRTVAALAVLVAGFQSGTAVASPSLPPVAAAHVPVCPDPKTPGFARCDALVRTDQAARAAIPARSSARANPDVLGNSGAYDPSYLQSAYNLSSSSSSSGLGRTIAVVDAYDSATAESDLAYYRSYFGLPPCSSSTGCLQKTDEYGGKNYPRGDSGWAQEISLDLDMASAICPNCSILLVEAATNGYADLGTAVNYAAGVSGVVAISNSYGGSEWSGETGYDAYYNHPGIAVTASAGDNGYGVEFPAASSYVTAVGGTTLNQVTNTGTRNATETAWSGTGSGCSGYEAKPTWQSDSGCTMRTVGDAAAVADPNTGVWVRHNGGWYIFGGTSVASPIVASVYALAGTSRGTSINPTSYPYADAQGLLDITSGADGSCGGGTYLCTAGSGYDGPTGLGTPNGTTAFASHAQPNYTMSLTPTSQTVVAGNSTGYTVGLAAVGGYSSLVNLAATGLPAGATASFNPASFTPNTAGSSATLTVATTAVTPSGTYTLTITATGTDSSATSHSATVTLVVSAPVRDFSVSASASSVTVIRGTSTATAITVSPANGYSATVSLAIGKLPRGVTTNFSPSSMSVPNQTTSTLTITAAQSAKVGTQNVTVTASGSDGTTHTVTVTVTVR